MAYTIGVFSFFALIIAVGMIVSRKVATVEDYYVSGRNAPTILVAGSLVASYFSTVTFMGEAATSYDGYPIIMLIFSMFNASGYVLGAFLFGRYLRRSEVLTIPEFFGKRFNSTRVRRAAATVTVLGLATYLVAVTQGISLLLAHILDIPFFTALVIVWVTYTSFTFMSGAKGVLITDTIMYFVFTIAVFIAVPFILKAGGGWPDAIINTNQIVDRIGTLSWHGILGEGAYMGTKFDALWWAVILGLSWAAVVAISPWQSSRYLMAKNEHVIIRTAAIATISILGLYLFFHITVSTIAYVNPNINPSEMVFIWSAENLMPTIFGVIVISGILAAGLSSCSTFLQLIGNSITRDFINVKSNQVYDNKKLLKYSKIAMLLSGLVVLVATIYPPPAVMWIGFFAATVFAGSWAPIAFTSIFSKKVNERAAFWSIVIGAAGVVGGEVINTFVYDLPIYLEPVLIGVVMALIALYAGTVTGKITNEEKLYREKLLQTPKESFDKKELRIDRRFSRVLMVVGAGIIMSTFVFYYLPVNIL
jgi:sodium/pantothenate symporter